MDIADIEDQRYVGTMSFFKNLFSKKAPVEYSKFDFNVLFQNQELDGVPLTLLPLGHLSLPTGKIIAGDPLVCFERLSPFKRAVAPGKYPVTVCIAKMDKFGDRYAVAKVEFSKEHSEIWEVAQTEDGGMKLKDGVLFGFGVDAGLGCFMDAKTQEAYLKFTDDFYAQNPNGNIYDDFFAAEFKKTALDEKDPGDWVNFYIPGQDNLNIVMFHSGFGDGFYQSYWGRTNNGEICNLVIDFKIFEV